LKPVKASPTPIVTSADSGHHDRTPLKPLLEALPLIPRHPDSGHHDRTPLKPGQAPQPIINQVNLIPVTTTGPH